MKLQFGEVRKIIREARSNLFLPELDGFKVGDYYVGPRGAVVRLVAIRPVKGATMAVTKTHGATIEQHFNVFAGDHVPATPEQVASHQAGAAADASLWRQGVDTSREGT